MTGQVLLVGETPRAEEAAWAHHVASARIVAPDELAAQLARGEAEPLVVALLPSVADPAGVARRLRRAWSQAHVLIWRPPADLEAFRRSLGPVPMLGRQWTAAPFDPERAPLQLRQAVAAAKQKQAFRTRVDNTNAQLAQLHQVARGEYQRLVASEHHLATFLKHSRDPVIGFDARLRVIFWSRAAQELFPAAGGSALGEALESLAPPLQALRPALEGVIGGGPTRLQDIEWDGGGAGRIVMEAVVSEVPLAEGEASASVVLRDVTQRRTAQEQLASANERLEEMVRQRTKELERSQQALVQSQKLEALGKLTGGVAHDFNNVLQVIGSNLQLLEMRASGDARALDLVKAALQATTRGAKLSSQLLSFARKQPLDPLPLDVNRRIEQMGDLLHRSLGEHVEVETVRAAGLWTTLADPVQLENVILNLAINARDAMPNGGKLTIETANVMLDENYTRGMDVNPGQYVMVAVTDTGTGMPPEVAAHAFEPFFTTKPEGQGTGLGLSMAYGFARQSGGHIRLYSELGIGTTVKLYLPRSFEKAVETAPAQPQPASGGSETILVVEDDPAVQAAVVNMLQGLGYTVLRANDGEAGVNVLRSGPHVDLLFTDVVMPGRVRSTELAKIAKALFPGIGVLFTSGYTQNAIVHAGRLDPGVELLSKPYLKEHLARKVRKVLDATRGQAPARAAGPSGSQQNEPPRRKLVLVVEDQEDLRETTRMLLETLGCEVLTAPSAEGAAPLLERAPDVVITDIALPGQGGVEFARSVHQRLPAARIVFCSGFGDVAGIPAQLPHVLLPKPYDLKDLMQVVGAD